MGPCDKCGSNKRDKNLACAACGATPRMPGQMPMIGERRMALFQGKPSLVEAVQWTGDWNAVEAAIGEKVRLRGDAIELLAGKDGAQEWVPVPLGHWLVHQPGDLSDVWPVDADYFAAKYDPVAP